MKTEPGKTLKKMNRDNDKKRGKKKALKKKRLVQLSIFDIKGVDNDGRRDNL